MCHYQMNKIRSVLFLVVSLACSTTFAAMYKWVDEEGITHYTQEPPPAGIESTTIKPPPAIDSSEAEKNLNKQQKFLEAEREKRQKRKRAKQRAAKEKARQEKNCEIGRARLKSLTDRPRVLEIQPDGTAIRPTEEQRQEEIAKSQENIKKFCK